MFGWFRRQDGFEWRNYVRTTILVRREQRRRKIDEVRAAAIDGVVDAGRKSAALGVSGFAAAGRSAIAAGKGMLSFLIAASAGFVGQLAAAIAALWRALLTLTARIPLGSARYHLNEFGAKLAARLRAGAAHLPSASILTDRLSAIPRRTAAIGGTITGLTLLLVVGAWLSPTGDRGDVARATPSREAAPAAPGTRLEGRAVARSGDSLRIDDKILRLAGIEAPDRDQTCQPVGGRSWPCGRAAADALSRLLRGRDIGCELAGVDDTGMQLATCRVGDADLADSLVRSGHVFAETGLFATYGSAESAARKARAGVWSGAIERPSAFRARRWEEAKRSAPEGCPIKGQVASGTRVYVLPWASSYERVKIRTHRGERWFCSEKEAQEAGWKPIERS